MVPHTYQSTASLWALHRYEIIGASGPESDLASSPAQTQATALNELLQTHTFVDAVVKGVALAPTLHLDTSTMNDPQQLENALYTEISKHVVTAPQAYNLFEVSYTNPNPQIARQIVANVISQFGAQSVGLSAVEGQNLLSSYQVQLANAEKASNAAAAAEAQYTAAHHTSNFTNDPQLANLDAAAVQAQANVRNIQATINTIQASIGAQGTNGSTLFQVLDPPQTPDRPLSRTKSFLVAGGVGLAVALLGIVLFIVILVRRNHPIYSKVELHQVIPVPLVMQLPKLSPTTISLLSLSNTQRRVELIESSSSVNGHKSRLRA